MPLKKDDVREYAKMLFLDTSQKLNQKEIASRCHVRPNTIGRWIKEGKWDTKRKSKLVQKPEVLANMYDQLETLLDHIKNRPITYDVPSHLLKPNKVKDKNGNEELVFQDYEETDYPIAVGNFPTSKEANQIAVITRSIKQLETETSIAEIFEVSTGFLDYLKPIDFDLHKTMIPYFDGFINSKIK